jgi:hypothetical protein
MGGGAVANEACEINQAKKGNHNMDVCACACVHMCVCMSVCAHMCANPNLGNRDRRPIERRHRRRHGGARGREVKCDAQTRRRRLKRLVESRKVRVGALRRGPDGARWQSKKWGVEKNRLVETATSHFDGSIVKKSRLDTRPCVCGEKMHDD